MSEDPATPGPSHSTRRNSSALIDIIKEENPISPRRWHGVNYVIIQKDNNNEIKFRFPKFWDFTQELAEHQIRHLYIKYCEVTETPVGPESQPTQLFRNLLRFELISQQLKSPENSGNETTLDSTLRRTHSELAIPTDSFKEEEESDESISLNPPEDFEHIEFSELPTPEPSPTKPTPRPLSRDEYLALLSPEARHNAWILKARRSYNKICEEHRDFIHHWDKHLFAREHKFDPTYNYNFNLLFKEEVDFIPELGQLFHIPDMSEVLTEADIVSLQASKALLDAAVAPFNADAPPTTAQNAINFEEIESILHEARRVSIEIGRHIPDANKPARRTLVNTIIADLRVLKLNLVTWEKAPVVLKPEKLPVLPLPKFNGEFSEWPQYNDTMMTRIHSVTTLSDAEKLERLVSTLLAVPKAHIQGLLATKASYQEVYDALKKKYQNPRDIMNSHFQNFENLPIAKRNGPEIANLYAVTTATRGAMTRDIPEAQRGDACLSYQLFNKLDLVTKEEVEKALAALSITGPFIPLDEFLKILDEIATRLTRAHPETQAKSVVNTNTNNNNRNNNNNTNNNNRQNNQTQRGASSSSSQDARPPSKLTCGFCGKSHRNVNCPDLQSMSIQDRRKLIREKKVCWNCMGPNHHSSICSKPKCGKDGCTEAHNALLHLPPKSSTPVEKPPTTNTAVVNIAENVNHTVLLATALIEISSTQGETLTARALIDGGSQINIITESLAQQLKLPRRTSHMSISGVSGNKTESTKGTTTIKVKSRIQEFDLDINCEILSKISNLQPQTQIPTSNLHHIVGLQLADPTFSTPQHIDMLLGANVFNEIIMPNKIPGQPTALQTKFGYILSGDVQGSPPSQVSVHFTESFDLKNFFFQEELPHPQVKVRSTEEKNAEVHFVSTHKRLPTGRYQVRLAIRMKRPRLGNSRNQAKNRLYSTEKRLRKNPQKHILYHAQMKELFDNGHLVPVPPEDLNKDDDQVCYLPHSYVEKDSTTTSLRVVFDASARSSTGVSLNDILMVGPTLQPELVTILLRFREHRYVFSADIKKMFNQVLIHEDDQDYQRILWRWSEDDPIQDYKLTCLTFGQSSSPFLAVRTIFQLAEDEQERFPLAKQVLTEDSYIDDSMSGDRSVTSTIAVQKDLISCCSSGGFDLRKWTANNPDLLEHIPEEKRETQIPFSLDDSEEIKTLGIWYDPTNDYFFFKITLPTETTFTKRKVVSYGSKTYDPPGWLQPVIILVKLIFQRLWISKTDWDQIIPPDIHKDWLNYLSGLKELEKLKIPRFILQEDVEQVTLHGFADASKAAYGAVIYLVCKGKNKTTSRIISSKSRVSPMKLTTIPRLELMAALLLAQLMTKTKSALRTPILETHYWSDSSTSLHWISSPSTKWKTFVGHRVQQIQELSEIGEWHHVAGIENPADLVSRGLQAAQIINNKMWWEGPPWLITGDLPIRPIPGLKPDVDLEAAPASIFSTVIDTPQWGESVINKFSSLPKLLNTTAILLRWKYRTSSRFVSSEELSRAMNKWIKVVQHDHFSKDIQILLQGKELIKSPLQGLRPFLDSDGVLRVGGRLTKANDLPEEMKHPVILPRTHLAHLIVRDIHKKNLHAASKLLLSTVLQNFWILGINKIIKKVIKECLICSKLAAKLGSQLMADLPAHRISVSRPFTHTGVDLAGPFLVLPRRGRGIQPTKKWVALFICFSTKAVHLDLVDDLSTDAFMATFKRFMARRGKPAAVYSDNATNFIGSINELKKIQQQIEDEMDFNEIAGLLARDGVAWHLNPPAAPHQGGLWESNIGRMKKHLVTAGEISHFTVDEFTTLLCQIEACLNSRPLAPVSSDPNDLSALTPGHFLIGDALNSTPEFDVSDLRINTLGRWQLVQLARRHFWTRWTKEYLHTLQHRPKWTNPQPNFQVGQLVIIKDDSLPPLKRKLARISKTHPGSDGKVRVVDLRTATTTINPSAGAKSPEKFKTVITELKRPVQKLCPLPFDDLEVDERMPRVVQPPTGNPGDQFQSPPQGLPRRSERLRQTKKNK